MKSLNNILFNVEFEEELLSRLYFHTCVEFKLSNNLYPYIIESYGKFDNAGPLLKYIIDSLKNNFNSQEINCTKYNVYFDILEINIKNFNVSNCSYLRFDKNKVKIEVFGTEEYFKNNLDDYVKLILHELLHGYEDYNRIKNTGKSIFDYLNYKYINSFRHLNSIDNIDLYLSRCNYFLNDQERNAYFSQLSLDIESIFKTNKINIENFSYNEFKNKLKNTSLWKEYFNLSMFIIQLYNNDLPEDQKIYIENKWYKLYNERQSFNTIRKDLYNKWKKFEKKFEQLVPKLICQYIEVNLKEVAFNVHALDQEVYWQNLI